MTTKAMTREEVIETIKSAFAVVKREACGSADERAATDEELKQVLTWIALVPGEREQNQP